MLDLAALAPVVDDIAWDHTRNRPHLRDDAFQEGMIAAWEALGKRPGMSGAYYRTAARNGVRGVTQGRSASGSPKRKGVRDSHASSVSIFSDEGGYITEPTIEDERAGAELAEVRDVVRALPRKDRVIAVGHALGMSLGEIAELAGTTRDAVRGRWRRTTQPILKERLAHLQAA